MVVQSESITCIIDGQQRLATLSLFIALIRDICQIKKNMQLKKVKKIKFG